MAVDVCSEISSLVTSPRISFSDDLNQTDTEYHRCGSDKLLVDFTADFDFCISNNSFLQETSSADELFSNGKILPTEIKKAETSKKETRLSEPILLQNQHSVTRSSKTLNASEDTNCKKLKEFLYEEEKAVASKSFWQFKRSTSLNCDGGKSKGFIRSLQTLARSNSTGSAAVTKQKVTPKVATQKHHSQKLPTVSSNNHHTLPTNSGYHQMYNSSGKPPLLKNCRSYSTGVQFNPVLNIPPAYVSKGTANLFGFGSFFCSGKSRKKKK
ncbi:Nucleoporin like [Heracleum sosnowskyi]|uniref:Nucleoporin like n=1 Tax=Heracleum sosnowskyi TaxID=360622 RepID=A0AAD8IT75_9APIA|nr:Nucleoporin like [Heracleum sosnowskyi]